MNDAQRQLMVDRLAQLRAEYASGEQQLAALEARTTDLRHTMLRISGAIQVLDEVLGAPDGGGER